jgi:hypothetical protein
LQHKSADATLKDCDAFVEPLVAAGGACGMDEACVGGSCRGAMIGKDGVCTPHARSGEACKDARCAGGSFCHGGTSTCAPAKPDTETCNLHSECQSGGCNGRNADAGTPGTCGPRGGENTRCYVTIGCAYAAGRPGGSGGAAAPGILALLTALTCAARRRVRRSRIQNASMKLCKGT